MKNLNKSTALIFIIVIIMQAFKSSNQIADRVKLEKYFYIVAQNKSGIVPKIMTTCDWFQIVRMDIVNQVDVNLIFLGAAQIPEILTIVIRTENDSNAIG